MFPLPSKLRYTIVVCLSASLPCIGSSPARPQGPHKATSEGCLPGLLMQAKPDSRSQRELRSLDVTDIPGAQPGWRPAQHQRNPGRRNPLDVTDICINDPTPQQKHWQLVGGAGGTQAQHGTTPRSPMVCPGSPARCSTAGGSVVRERLVFSAPPAPCAGLGDVGVIKNVDW
jgi:hypothetical protein